MAADNSVHVVINDEDLHFEEELLRNAHSLKSWLRYLDARQDASPKVLNLLFERAVKALPGSYKLWYRFLKTKQSQAKGRCITDPFFEDVNNTFERALVFMNKMPRIWLEYCSFLVKQRKITRTRRVFDRALRALPVTQHERIWPLYIDFIKAPEGIQETAIRVFRRYLQIFPDNAEEYVDFLISVDRLDEAATALAKLVNDPDFVSKHGKSNHSLWHQLCQLISKNPHKIKSLNVDAIIRSGLRRYTDQIGHLWNSLADFYIRSGLFERARDIYEEAIVTVTTVRDFTQVFDAYAQFTELSLSKEMEEANDQDSEIDVELHMARFEDLIERRPLLLNSVLLRQNPHNVAEWQKRVDLLTGKPKQVITTFTEAIQTIDPKQAVGKLHSLWVNFAKFYESNKQLNDARIIFEKATHVSFVRVEDLASVWCEWVEMELRHNHFERGLELLRRATAPPPRRISYHDTSETVQMRLHKSLKIWSLYADLEESFGTFQTTKAVYDRILELRIATPQIIINYGMFLKENNYFEEAFKAYEKGIAMFKWPNVFDIWNMYLTDFLNRYGGTKIERTRDLFEQCLETCPAKYAKPIYLLYAKLEEDHGLARHAMSVYDRAIEAVEPSERFGLFNIYLQKAAEIYGVTRTRQIYEKAIEILSDAEAKEMCLRFAEMETKLGEIDRARAIYGHCSQMADPRVSENFWLQWKEFEVKQGNEDTLREMLRLKRAVMHAYNTQVNMMSAQMISPAVPEPDFAPDNAPASRMDKMQILEATTKTSNISFVRGETQPKSQLQMESDKPTFTNPDEINIDDEDDDEDGDEEEGRESGSVEKQAIPSKVFGGLKTNDDEDVASAV